jgi:uncharacterized protein YceK
MKFSIVLLIWAVVSLTSCSSTKTHTSPKEWNAVTDGMTRREVANRVGGGPTSQSSVGEVWRRHGWELRVAYDEGGRVTNVVRQLILPVAKPDETTEK